MTALIPLTGFLGMVGGIVALGVADAEGAVLPGGAALLDPLYYWYRWQDDHSAGVLWWLSLQVSVDGHELIEGRDDWPPASVQRLLLSEGLNLDDPTVWLLQRSAFDHRPADRLPDWWVEKLRSVGAWDEERRDLAVDENGNPLYGPKLILDSSSDE